MPESANQNPFIDPATNESIFGEPYSSNETVDRLARSVVSAIEDAKGGEPSFEGLSVEKMRKMATLALKADASNVEKRHQPGNRLRTYVFKDGVLKEETENKEVLVGEGHTIYRNTDPLVYPEDWSVEALRGTPVRGHYEDDGTFVVEENGSETLYNEYVTSNPDHPMKKYGIVPVIGEWTEGLAQIPSYLVQIPEGVGEVTVRTKGGKLISVASGDFLVVDDLGNGSTSVQAIEKGFKERTYKP